MRSTRHANRQLGRPLYYTLFLLLLILLTPAFVARAADDETDGADEYDVTARVVRISLLAGEVNLKRAGKTKFEPARLNLPLVEGDTISTGSTDRDSRVEIQIDANNFIRLGANSALKIVTLREEGVALSLVEGTASVRLAKFDHDHESFEIDAPKTTLAAEKTGLYRIDVGKDGHVRLTARGGGRARIYSETSGFALRDGRAAELIIDGPDAGEWELLAANEADSWDDWNSERERTLAQRQRVDNKYYDDDLWGAEDLDAYGNWSYTTDYGWLWRPHTTAISSYNDWAPYRYGEWTWLPPYGWTWVGNEPWGWAPYHYGRWVYYNNYWAWVPHSEIKSRRSWWRPALVAFLSIDFSFGNQVCWYPLSYHERDPRSRNYRRDRDDDRRSGRDRNDRREPWRENRWRGLTAIPTRDFGGEHPRTRPIDQRWARRAVDAEPLRDVPIRPASETNRTRRGGTNAGSVAQSGEDRRREWTERRTGAANRNPGVPLDTELRRSRTWSGRDTRSQLPVPSGAATGETRPTDLNQRPARSLRDGEVGAGAGADPIREGGWNRDRNRERAERPAQSNQAVPTENSPNSGETNQPQSATEAHIPAGSRQREERSVDDAPGRPEGFHRPAAGNSAERPEQHERRDDSSARPARSERSEPSRAEPAHREQRSEPTRHESPRSEPARHEEPRNDPPAQAESRSEPPQHSEPAPQQSEPAKSDTPAPSESTPTEPAKPETPPLRS